MLASEKQKKFDDVKIAILLTILGKEGLKIYGECKKNSYDAILKHFEQYCVPKCNIVLERFLFFTTNEEGEQEFDSYLTWLYTLASWHHLANSGN